MSKKIDYCPICKSSGVDLIFSFYCSNKSCQNYKYSEVETDDEIDDETIEDLWCADYF